MPSSHDAALFVRTQTPCVQASVVHGLRSSHSPSAEQEVHAGMGACVQPEVAAQASVVHASPSSQVSGGPGVQVAARQVSAPLQGLPSLHAVSSGIGLRSQRPAVHVSRVQGLLSSHWLVVVQEEQLVMGACVQPVVVSHASVVQAFPSLQLRDAPALQVPAVHVSTPLHGLRSSHWAAPVQGVQPEITAWPHPDAGLQVSVVQAFASSQSSAGPVRQAPVWQVSAPLHWLPSLQAVPLVTAFRSQRPAVQRSAVQELLSLHWLALLQAVQPGIVAWPHPLVALQESVVQAFASSQLSAVPGRQVPVWQVSAPLHWFPSLQAVPFAAVLR